jgi:NAD(P)H dehydrogenase (quinone)
MCAAAVPGASRGVGIGCRTLAPMSSKLVIIGGGPAGNHCASNAARLGAEVVMIERDIVGGAAHLLDCIPSKAMIATGGAISFINRAEGMGLEDIEVAIDARALDERVSSIEETLHQQMVNMLTSQGVQIVRGTGRLVGTNSVVADTEDGELEFEADTIVLSTGSRPRIPDFATPDAERILTTRDAYPPPEMPDHLVVIGSGVTGVEFVHMFNSLGSDVTLLVSRQQVLPQKDPEVAAALEENFLRRGVHLFKGARATNIERTSHALLAIGSIPNSESLGLDAAGVDVDDSGYVVVDHNLRSSVPHIYAAGDLSGKLPLSSVAAMQGRKIAAHAMGLHLSRPHRHLDYDKAASAIFTEPEIADVGLAEADAFAEGRKIRVTKVPFSVAAKALINHDPRGFVKILSDPATGVILGGSIVGRHAAELISVIAIAVTAGLTVEDLSETLMVHPALSEVLAEAAE